MPYICISVVGERLQLMCRFHSPSAPPGAALPVCLWCDALIRARAVPRHHGTPEPHGIYSTYLPGRVH